MTVKESTLINQAEKTYTTNLGNIYFFEDFVITEFNEGVHITFENSEEYLMLIKSHFKNKTSFGYITNMINSYSISPMDSCNIKKDLINLSCSGVVCYSNANRMNAEIENRFCDSNNKIHNNLFEAIDYVNSNLIHMNTALKAYS